MKTFKIISYSIIVISFIGWIFYSPMFIYNNIEFLNANLSLIVGNYITLSVLLLAVYIKYKPKFVIYIFLFSLTFVTAASLYFNNNTLESSNFKNDSEIEQYNNKTHTILKYYTAMFSVLDDELIITDSKRVPDDYSKMNLKEFERSLHYVQSDGYSHALDIRSKDRTYFSKFLVTSYYQSLGFDIIEHDGTNIHFHVDDRNIRR